MPSRKRKLPPSSAAITTEGNFNLPKPTKNDKRIQFTKHFLDAFNSCDNNVLRDILHRYCVEDVEAIHRYDGINNPFGTNYRQLRSITSISTLWCSLFESAPDFSFILLSTKLVQSNGPDEGDAIVESTFTFSGTRVMDVAIQQRAAISGTTASTNIKNENTTPNITMNTTQNLTILLDNSVDTKSDSMISTDNNCNSETNHIPHSAASNSNTTPLSLPTVDGKFQYHRKDVHGLQCLSSSYYNDSQLPKNNARFSEIAAHNSAGVDESASDRPNSIRLTCKVDPRLLSIFAQQCASGNRGGASLAVEEPPSPCRSRSSSHSGDTDTSTSSSSRSSKSSKKLSGDQSLFTPIGESIFTTAQPIMTGATTLVVGPVLRKVLFMDYTGIFRLYLRRDCSPPVVVANGAHVERGGEGVKMTAGGAAMLNNIVPSATVIPSFAGEGQDAILDKVYRMEFVYTAQKYSES